MVPDHLKVMRFISAAGAGWSVTLLVEKHARQFLSGRWIGPYFVYSLLSAEPPCAPGSLCLPIYTRNWAINHATWRGR